jgi:hypothetical protein
MIDITRVEDLYDVGDVDVSGAVRMELGWN